MDERTWNAGRKKRMVVWGVLLLEIAMLVFAVWKWGAQRIDSDDSAEMILAELLSRAGGIMTQNWYYSTELRVGNTQLVMAPLFRLFSHWHTVRVTGTLILLVILTLSFARLCRATRLGDRLFFFAPILLWPFSYVYMDIVLFGLYYIPHLSILFLGLALCLDEREKRRGLRLAALGALAFLAGLSGIRMLVICFAPLLGAAILPAVLRGEDAGERRRFFARAVLAFGACLMGYIVNIAVLARIYSFVNWTDLRLGAPNWAKLHPIATGVLKVLGAEGPVSPAAVIVDLLVGAFCLLLAGMALRLCVHWGSLRTEAQVLLATFFFSFLATVAPPLLTRQQFSARYLIMPCVGVLAVLAAYLDRFPPRPRGKRALAAFLIAMELSLGAYQYHTFATTDKFASVGPAFQCILDSGMEFGFGDWDTSDSLTELSDGRVHTCRVYNYRNPDVWYWLMEKDFRKYGEGKPVFVIYEDSRLDFHGSIGHVAGEWTRQDLKYLDKGEVIFADGTYTVWRYETLEALEEAAGTHF